MLPIAWDTITRIVPTIKVRQRKCTGAITHTPYVYGIPRSKILIHAKTRMMLNFLATSFFYIYVMATSFFYIYIDIYIDIFIDINITFTNWQSVQSFYWTLFFLLQRHFAKKKPEIWLDFEQHSLLFKRWKHKKTPRFQKQQDVSFHIAYPGYLRNFCNREKCVCVCIVLVHYGPFPQEINGKSVKLAVWAVSLNFLHDFTLFVVDKHHIRHISPFPTSYDHFHFHGSARLVPKLILTLCLI